jgi:hypothetical protein
MITTGDLLAPHSRNTGLCAKRIFIFMSVWVLPQRRGASKNPKLGTVTAVSGVGTADYCLSSGEGGG